MTGIGQQQLSHSHPRKTRCWQLFERWSCLHQELDDADPFGLVVFERGFQKEEEIDGGRRKKRRQEEDPVVVGICGSCL